MSKARTSHVHSLRGLSTYAAENKRRQAEWEPAFRARIEALIAECGGPGAVQDAAGIKSQTLQKIRKGGSRLALFAIFCEVTGANIHWLLLGNLSEPRRRRPSLGVVVDDEMAQIAVPERRPAQRKSEERTAVSSKNKLGVGNARRVR